MPLPAIRSHKLNSQKLRLALRYQLRGIRRNQKSIARLYQHISREVIEKRQYRALLVVEELERQQGILFAMNQGERQSVPDNS